MIQIFQGRYIPHLYDLHDLDHAAASEPHYQRDLERVSWVESVLGQMLRSSTTYISYRTDDDLDHDLDCDLDRVIDRDLEPDVW